MNINKIYVIGSLIAILLIIGVPTIYKVVNNHNNNLYRVVEDRIINGAKKCYYEEKCINEKITLKELLALNYIDKVSNPITKEYYNEKSYVLRNNNDFKFVEVK